MPTFITKEQFSCAHSLEMVHRRTGSDRLVLTETLPVPLRCMSCIFQELLDASVDGIPCIPRSRAAELDRHLKMLGQDEMAGQLGLGRSRSRSLVVWRSSEQEFLAR
ncbi:hypothetical protein DL769_002818 [Monosporascus sp. CRB-8-3]|nr:hypothetical protein DL769_002818 [Monosporascus sp. CRB-8-3]